MDEKRCGAMEMQAPEHSAGAEEEQEDFKRLYSLLLFITALWIAGKLFARAGPEFFLVLVAD